MEIVIKQLMESFIIIKAFMIVLNFAKHAFSIQLFRTHIVQIVMKIIFHSMENVKDVDNFVKFALNIMIFF